MNSTDSTTNNIYSLETELNDILTLDSGITLISELIKFILYRKQQLPYTFDRLKYLITKRNSKEVKESLGGNLSSVERQFKIAENGLATLELLFEKTKEELANSRKGCISEIALLFGSTPMTPKQVYIIHLPQVCLDHSAHNHPERKHLLHMLQSVIFSNNFTNMLTKPMNPTNMYVFIKKNGETSVNDVSDADQWFKPKNRYQIPRSGQHFHIKFRHPNLHIDKCKCKHLKIYSDTESSSLVPEILESANADLDNAESKPNENCWYQAGGTFTGFTDVLVNGVSVANLWLR